MLLRKAERAYRLTTADYARLAAFRAAVREFLHFSEAAAAQAGLTAQHYQAMLILRASGDEASLAINDLARRLLIKHNSAVGLVDRLAGEGLVLREASKTDRRKVELRLSARGRQVLAKLASMHRREIGRIRPMLENLIADVFREGPSKPE
ncbi:MAG TPA: MarR family transcriptional regulator [Usitatibacter sp.]|nr:MarR family transcriptional regulator [Usitatibacter sp.]